MASLGDERLVELLNGGESDRVEFKESLRGGVSESAREAICAFSNDLPGHGEPGAVFVGVRDDGSPTGMAVSDEALRQLADMKTDGNILPPPSMTVRRLIHRGDAIAAAVVYPSDSPPVRFNGRIHIRIGPRRGIATAQDERILNERRRHKDIPFDIHPIPSANLSDLDTLYGELAVFPTRSVARIPMSSSLPQDSGCGSQPSPARRCCRELSFRKDRLG